MKPIKKRKFILSRTSDTYSEVFYTMQEAYKRMLEILKKEEYVSYYTRTIVIDEDTLKLDYGSYNDFFYIKREYEED